jgi:hypothetical protein
MSPVAESLLEGIDLPNVRGAALAVLLPKPLDNLALERPIRCAVLNDLQIALEGKINIGQGGKK